MIACIERLRLARGSLDQTGPSAADLEALIAAAEECWSASIDGTDWPVDLRVRIATLQRMIFQHGGIRATIERMNAHEQAVLRRDLLALIAAAEQACQRL